MNVFDDIIIDIAIIIIMIAVYVQFTHCGHPSPVDTVKRVSRAQATLS